MDSILAEWLKVRGGEMDIRKQKDGTHRVTMVDEKALALVYSVDAEPIETLETRLRDAMNEAKSAPKGGTQGG